VGSFCEEFAPETMPKRKRGAGATECSSVREARTAGNSKPIPSGDCGANVCTCRSPAAAVDAALERVRGTKSFVGSMQSRGPFNDEKVLRAICDDYLSHSRRAEDLKPKQVRLREAMRRVAARVDMPFLPHFNCKTTSLRTLGRALWEGCGLASEPKHKAEELVGRQREDGALVEAVFESLKAASRSLAGPHPPLPLWADEPARRACQGELQANGITLLRGFVPEETCEWLLGRVCEHRSKHSPTWLTETMALGRRGCYFDKDWNLTVLKHIQTRVVEALGLSPTEIGAANAVLPSANNKSVLLVYGEGGENWAHQDDNRDFSFQALLMLSQPEVDFRGGALYVIDGGRHGSSTSAKKSPILLQTRPANMFRHTEEGGEEEFFDHYKNELKRHAQRINPNKRYIATNMCALQGLAKELRKLCSARRRGSISVKRRVLSRHGGGVGGLWRRVSSCGSGASAQALMVMMRRRTSSSVDRVLDRNRSLIANKALIAINNIYIYIYIYI